MRRYALLLGSVALLAAVTLPAAASSKHHHHKAKCGDSRGGWEVIYDGSKRCFERWRYAGGASITRQRDGTLKTGPGAPGLGVLWYAARPYGDFVMKMQLRDDAPAADARANSGVQVRFPAPHPPVPGCPTADPGWVAVVCGHEIQVNDSQDGGDADPRKTGSIYGFADLDSAHSHPVPKGEWYELEIRVVGQHYTVVRNGAVINEFDNPPDAPFPGRPDDPGSKSRGLVGYVGLQSHGGENDVVSFRDVRIKDLSDHD
jgi:hypothetical protein